VKFQGEHESLRVYLYLDCSTCYEHPYMAILVGHIGDSINIINVLIGSGMHGPPGVVLLQLKTRFKKN